MSVSSLGQMLILGIVYIYVIGLVKITVFKRKETEISEYKKLLLWAVICTILLLFVLHLIDWFSSTLLVGVGVTITIGFVFENILQPIIFPNKDKKETGSFKNIVKELGNVIPYIGLYVIFYTLFGM